MVIQIKVSITQARDKLGRFRSAIDSGLREEMEQVLEATKDIYRQEIENAGIKQRSGRLVEGIGTQSYSPKKMRAVVGPSKDRQEVMEWLDQGLDLHDMIPRRGGAMVMEKVGEGEVIRSRVYGHYIRKFNVVDKVRKRVDDMLKDDFPGLVQIRINGIGL